MFYSVSLWDPNKFNVLGSMEIWNSRQFIKAIKLSRQVEVSPISFALFLPGGRLRGGQSKISNLQVLSLLLQQVNKQQQSHHMIPNWKELKELLM